MNMIGKNRIATVALLGALTLPLAACGGDTTFNRSMQSVHQPVVSYTSFTYDVMPGASGELSHQEAVRLEGWLSSIGLGYGDHVVIAGDPSYYSASVRDGIANVVARHGLLIEEDDTLQAGQPTDGGLRLIVRRAVASVPRLPSGVIDQSSTVFASAPGLPATLKGAVSNSGERA